jgi:hypothetical protein
MTPERAAALVARWVRLYTRGVPAPVARRRVEEIDADLHDHVAHERAAGVDERRIARGIASRLVRGLAADLAWHAKAARIPTAEESMKPATPVHRSVLRVALGVAAVLALPAIAMQLDDGADWSAADFVLAGVLLTVVGVAIELAVRRSGNLATAAGIAALGVAAIAFGEGDDAPGLVLLGLLLLAGGCAMGVRRLQRSR